jgi:hypothetical protein
MNARQAPITVTTKDVDLTPSSQSKHDTEFEFKNLFAPQIVTLKPLGRPNAISFASNLPQTLQLTPTFQDGNLALIVSGALFNPQDPPQPIPIWTVQNSMINSQDGVSIVLVDNLGDLLVLSGKSGANSLLAEGQWRSNLFPGIGTWSSKIAGEGSLPAEFWWTFLLAPDTDNTDPEDFVGTVILGFQATGSNDQPFEQYTAFPIGWQAFDLDFVDTGVKLTLVSPGGRQYCLNSGSFSGGLGQLVCSGKWKRRNPDEPPCSQISAGLQGDDPLVGGDGGTWTGTSSGPVPPTTGP